MTKTIQYRRGLAALASLLAFTLPLAAEPAGQDKIAPAIPLRALPFEPRDVRLLDGPFLHAMELDGKFLLSLEPDRLLSLFRKEAGLQPKAENYGGWEGRGLAGHSLGHYLSGCARLYQTTGNPEFRQRVDYVVAELAECQRTNGDGYVEAIPGGRKMFAELREGRIRSSGFDLNGGWVPWYNIHKLFAGLIDSARYAQSAQAVEVATNLANWTGNVTQNLNPAQWQRMLACEHGGMNEALADLYALTGNRSYLELARSFYHQAVLDPLAAQRDELNGKHANTQIPKIIGAARLYELTGEPRFATISSFFWATVTRHHSYVTGGNSLSEHFGAPDHLDERLGSKTAETCNTYNMLKLTRKLFERDPQAAYADYYERALWNHILASQNPETGHVCYFVSLEPGTRKEFLGPLDFTCCNGTGMENHGSYNDNIYFHSAGELWVNQFIASELTWTNPQIRLRQETTFPASSQAQLRVSCAQPVKLALHLRHPFWATNGFTLKLNGQPVADSSLPQSYATIDREWKDGDTVEIDMPLSLRTEAMPDNANRIAFFDGPILLAGDLSPMPAGAPVPTFVSESRNLTPYLKPVAAQALNFTVAEAAQPAGFQLKPFYQTYSNRSSVYWETMTPQAWEQRKTALAAEARARQELEARTTDWFQPGEMQPERDHNLQGEKSDPGEYNSRKLRHATDGGWFAFDMKVDALKTNQLVCTWWGGENGKRTFDILVNGTLLTTQTLLNNRPGKFWDATYPIPSNLTQGRNKITVKLAAHPGNFAGGLFGCRMVRATPQ
jgi:DUF1680 family protein